MPNINLKRFERRVRLVRAWRGAAEGTLAGAIAASVWAALDWANVFYTEWSYLAATVVTGLVAGALVGYFRSVSRASLAVSVDRRASLEDRLTTSLERDGQVSAFDDALRTDAGTQLSGVQPKSLYPMKPGRWHVAALSFIALTSLLFLLGNTPVLLNEQQKANRGQVKKAGQEVQHVLKPLEDADQHSLSPDEKKLAEALRRLSRELNKAHISKELALQKTTEIQKQAEQLVKDRGEKMAQSLASAESAFDKLQREQFEKAGAKGLDPKVAEQMASMSEAQRTEAAAQLGQQLQSLQQQMSSLEAKAANAKSPEDKKQLEDQLKHLKEQYEKISSLLQQMKLSEKVMDMIQRMRNNPIFKELQELAKKMSSAAQQAQQAGQQQKLTAEQVAELKKKLEELAEQLKDDKAMSEYLQKLLEAMKNANGTCNGTGVGIGLQGLLARLAGLNMGAGAPTSDNSYLGTDRVNQSDKPEKSQGKTSLQMIQGERDPSKKGESYIEFRGPATLNGRSSIQYTKDVVGAKQKAEKAIDRQKIPKEYQQRVKKYFESLSGGK